MLYTLLSYWTPWQRASVRLDEDWDRQGRWPNRGRGDRTPVDAGLLRCEFLSASELTDTRAFVQSFVKKVEVRAGKGTIVYTIPTPDDSPMWGADTAEVSLSGRVMNSVLLRRFWWAWQDSNLRPHGCEPYALAG